MTKSTVYILADNIITSLGFDTISNLEKIAAEQTGIALCSDTSISPSPVWVSKIDDNLLVAQVNKQLKNASNYTRLEQLFLLSIQNALAQTTVDLSSKETLIIIASTKGNIDLLKQEQAQFPANRVQLGTMAAQIQDYYKNPNTPLVVCNACISGVLALDVAKRLLQQKKYKNIIVTGGDLISKFTVSGFQSFKAMSDAPCKPYDKNRVGINLGEGVGTVILSSQQPISNKGFVTIEGGASSNDANHISGPSRTGDGLFIAIKKALKEADCTAAELDYLSMHGTATPFNDEMEAKALNLANLQAVPMNSYKGYIGHTLGAAGLIESIISIHSLYNNTLYCSLGFEELGVTEPINVITKTTKKTLTKCLKTASGFGGCNAAMVFSYNENPTKNTALERASKSSALYSSCEIKNEQIYLDGQLVFEKKDSNFAQFIKEAYKHFELDYPKFHKMDRLCKLAFVTASILLGKNGFDGYNPEEIGVVIANANSTLHTDSKHAESIQDKENYFPSPAVFVYTLPNIMVGEICIRYNIKGESVFFVSTNFDQDFLIKYSEEMLVDGIAKTCLTGWVDYTEEDYHAILFLIK